MRLALVIDDYLPHSTRVGAKMFHDLACYYVSQGIEVTVITPLESQKKALIVSELDGVTVWSFSSGAIKDVNKVRRALNESVLSLRAWRAISPRVCSQTFDGVIYYSPSIFFGGLVSRIKSRCNCKAFLVLRDLFPQWVVDAGMIKKGSLIERYFRYFEEYSYSQADSIGLMSANNKSLFDTLTNERYSTCILRNWAALTPHTISDGYVSLRKKLGLDNKVIFFYGGNIGRAQDMENLLRLVKSMKKYEKAHFLFIGQGDEVDLIQSLANQWQLDNFTYLPSVNQVEFRNIMSEADVGLFSLAYNHTAHNFPGKLLGYMVQSMPILGSVNPGNDLLELVNDNCAGLISINGDDEQLFENARFFLESDCQRSKYGKNGAILLEREFSVEKIASRALEHLVD
ncbi:glycosyltransferase family 4 protein [Enterovibrio sp. 27052020O]|uniref:glycosyltransferase family 4 protein n=1 Tax=Enterovibrio sp. 27052020O TaxID=3241166 RepID=UPI00388EFDCD